MTTVVYNILARVRSEAWADAAMQKVTTARTDAPAHKHSSNDHAYDKENYPYGAVRSCARCRTLCLSRLVLRIQDGEQGHHRFFDTSVRDEIADPRLQLCSEAGVLARHFFSAHYLHLPIIAHFEEDGKKCIPMSKVPTLKDRVRVLIDGVIWVFPRGEDGDIDPITRPGRRDKCVYPFSAVTIEDIPVVIEGPNGERES